MDMVVVLLLAGAAAVRAYVSAGTAPTVTLEVGRRYRLRGWPDDGEVFEFDGYRLVNLTTSGGDLLVDDECLRCCEHGHDANRVEDLIEVHGCVTASGQPPHSS